MAYIVYFCIILSSAIQSSSVKQYNRKNSGSSPFYFNAFKALSAFAAFAAASFFGFTLHMPTVLYGVFYGLALCLSMHAGYRALCLGPMALTSMLVSFSLIIPLIWSISFGDEVIGLIQLVAIVCLFVSMVAVNIDKIRKSSAGETNYGLWLTFVALTFISNGVCSILQKEHQRAFPGQFNKEFMFFSMLVCTVIYLGASIIKSPKGLGRMEGKGYAVVSGITNALSGFLTLALAGFENASVLFPIISAGTIMASLLCGRFIFKEKLKINHYIAILFGTAAVVLLKL